jgi:single-strand DNA-binding protein
MSFNKITIVGYLGRDPELRYTPQGTAVCKMSVATTERRKNVAGQPEEITTWFRVTVWGRQAELANEYLTKGRQIYLEGRLRLEEYTDRDGNTRYSPEVTATDLQFLGQRNEQTDHAAANTEQNNREEEKSDGAKPAATKSSSKGSGSRRASNKELVSIEEDDIPF